MAPDFKKNMIEAMRSYIHNLEDYNSWDFEEEDVADAFIAGAEWAVEQLTGKS